MQQRLTREEYLRWVAGQPKRYERIAGEPVPMSAARVQQVRVKARVWAVLDQAVRQAGLDCEALGDRMTIEVGPDTDYEPDAVVNCGPPLPPYTTVATNPVIVVEVLSPATQSIDTGDKLADYFRVPSIQHYLVLRTRRPEIIHHSRAGGEIISRVITAGAIRLDPPGIAIEAGEIYLAAG